MNVNVNLSPKQTIQWHFQGDPYVQVNIGLKSQLLAILSILYVIFLKGVCFLFFWFFYFLQVAWLTVLEFLVVQRQNQNQEGGVFTGIC